MKATERLYTNADRTKICKEGDEDAAFLLVAKGQEINPKLVEAYGLKEESEKAAPKKKKKPEDKQAKEPENKSGSGLKVNTLKDKEKKADG